MGAKIAVKEIESLVRQMIFGQDKARQNQIRDMVEANGIFPASIQSLYDVIGKGKYKGFTVPAMNIRGITYDVARTAFRAAVKDNVGAFIFELARSEMAYTLQRPGEYTACILAAALAEGYKGPVFIQGDHMQINRKRFAEDSQKELDSIRSLVKEAIEAGFYNIDIDASTVVDIEKPDLLDQQELNGRITGEMTEYIRSIEPRGITVSVGGEIGEIGKGNSTEEDLQAFMKKYHENIGSDTRGISKISVQTGTTHGGIALSDGSIAKVNLDFETLEKLSRLARDEYGMGGAVQHGASTLPDNMFVLFPKHGTLEVHLATGFQNIIFDSPNFPKTLMDKIHAGLTEKYGNERKSGQTDAQFYYSTRKRAFGDFKADLWNLPEENMRKIELELEERFSQLYHSLNVVNTADIVNKEVKPGV